MLLKREAWVGTFSCWLIWISFYLSKITTMINPQALTLTSGQRIVPLPANTKDRSALTDPRDSITPIHKRSLLDLPAVEQWASDYGLTQQHVKTIYHVVMKTPATIHIHNNSTIVNTVEYPYIEEELCKASFPKQIAQQLLSDFQICSLTLVQHQSSTTCGGEKFGMRLGSGRIVETVLIRHSTRRGIRYTICLSSQAGCARGCSFCATGTLGLQQNLHASEILEQVWLAQQVLQNKYPGNKPLLRNAVFMGQGEPMDNFAAVHEACRGLTHQCLFGFQSRHVTISTVGATPHHFRWLADTAPRVRLAVSLHGATQTLRERLVPAARHAPLEELEQALDYHAQQTGVSAMLEYLLIQGVNDEPEACDALVAFCERRQAKQQMSCYVNLIPYNPTIAGESFGYQTPSDAAIQSFHQNLLDAGVRSHVRWSSAAGRDVQAACGQLALQFERKTEDLSMGG